MPDQREHPRDRSAAHPPEPPSFEEGLAQLADLVNRLEGGGLGLSESIAAYERGVALVRGLHEELARAEERIRVLTSVDAEGRPLTAPFTAGDAPVAEGSATGGDRVGRRTASRRQSGRPPTLPGMDDPPAEA